MLGKKINALNVQSQETKKMIATHAAELKKKDECIVEAAQGVNELLMNITKLDYVREMIMNANVQAEMLTTLAASSEEMAAATLEISEYVQNSNDGMRQTMQETSQSITQVDSAFKKVEENINDIEAVKNIMTEVAAETVQINEIVSVITAVADQTNLLSLNASIEAARAGEHGRGFAVVADEIKKLAVNTKEQVVIIGQIVDGLNSKINKASSEIGNVVETFGASKEAIDSAMSGINQINDTMGMVGESFSSITANVADQTTATEEISSNLQVINEKSIVLKTDSNRTGQALFNVSQEVDKIRLKTIADANGNVDDRSMIELAITDHLMWKWRVYNMILGYVNLDTASVGDHTSCRLGKFLSTLDNSDGRIRDIMMKIDQPHAIIHRSAKQAIEENRRGEKSAAERTLEIIDTNSQIVVNYLLELKKLL